MVAPLNKFYGKIWFGFCLDTGKHFFLEVFFKVNRKSIGSSKKWNQGLSKKPFFWEISVFNVFNTLILKQIFWKVKIENLFQKSRGQLFSWKY